MFSAGPRLLALAQVMISQLSSVWEDVDEEC